jgi:hypothetical protein
MWFSALLGGLISVAGTIVGKVLLSLGIGYVAYQGVDTAMEWVKVVFLSGVSGLPADAVGVMATMKVGVCFSMLFSALTIRLVMAGLTGGAIKRMVLT